jgi:hypothetical protein
VTAVDVYLESGAKRVFAGALDWPGWCRAGRDEEHALEALDAAAPRYRRALGGAGRRFPARIELRLTERLTGNATTDFGAPGIAPSTDDRPMTAAELRRWTAILEAAWSAFDRVASAHRSARLRTGPRSGGRALAKIIDHVTEAEGAYLTKLGGQKPAKTDRASLRTAELETLAIRGRGEPPPRTPRSGMPWSPRYFVRRAAWHALDHAWEIEDRAQP